MEYLEGIDVSHWQGTLDWSTIRCAKKSFAFVKATEGVGYEDPRFRQNWEGAELAGLVRGAYHFARVSRVIDVDARAEAEWFIQVAGVPAAGDLPLTLDVEWDNRASDITAEEVVRWCEIFLEFVEAETSRIPIVYTGPSFWRYRLGRTSALQRYLLWEVQYTANPQPKPLGDWPWTFWQYTSKGNISGINGNIDFNRYRGSSDELRLLAKLPPDAPIVGEPDLTPPKPPDGFSLPEVDLTRAGPSESVERVQALLLAHGHGPDGLLNDDGFPDGLAGPRTRLALKRFKTANLLPGPSHHVDRATWWLLLSGGILCRNDNLND